MSNETKRDVLEYYLDMIKGLKDPLAAECVRVARKRYAAASDGDPDCQYCHTPSGREVTKQEYINDYMTDEATGDPIDTLDIGMLIGITCCQWCGRRLEAIHEPA